MKKTGRREFLKMAGMAAGASLTGLGALSCKPQSFKKKPNVLFIFTDDQRFDTIGALNNPHVKTPNLDRLVRMGVSFTRAHIMGGTSGAVCMPSRAMLMTGRTLFHLENRGATIPSDHALLPQVLREAGYRTFVTGKWHNGRAALARSFSDGGKIFFGGMSDHLKVPVYDYDPSGLYAEDGKYLASQFSSELFSEEGIRFLKENHEEHPFFLYISYTAPHDPRMAPKEFTDMYPTQDIELPPNFLPRHPFDNGEMSIRDENLAPFPRTPEAVREHLAAYYAMISHLDYHIGRVLEALEESGGADNTIIIMAGDNGLAVGQHGLLGKQNLYDHSVRVPLIISGPGIPSDVRDHSLCYLLDIFPTLCEWLGLPVPDSVEGKSLMAQVKRKKGAGIHRSSLFLAYTKLQRGIRTDSDWKLIKYMVGGKETTQLFDLNRDPWEKNNLAGDPLFSEQQDSLTSLLRQHMGELDDFCDLDKPYWGLPVEKSETTMIRHLAVGCSVRIQNGAVPRYTEAGPAVLTDGIRASSNFKDGFWLGLEGEDLDVVLDLGELKRISKVSAGFLEAQPSWIFPPTSIEVLLSRDGGAYTVSSNLSLDPVEANEFRRVREVFAEFDGAEARFIRIKAAGLGRCPAWHQGAGGKAWLFVDEIVVV